MQKSICILPGDGIGEEIVREAERVLLAAGQRFGHSFETRRALIGGAAIDETGVPLPQETVEACRQADGVLLGAVGGGRWDSLEPSIRPEKGLLGIRKELGLFANLRPAVIFPQLKEASFLRPDIVQAGIDIMVVRELTGGIYFAEPRGVDRGEGGRVGYNTMRYSEGEIRRIAGAAFDIAARRRGALCSVDKANVLDVSRLWRDVVTELGQERPEIELSHMYVDNAAMQLVRDPNQFDVIVTSNLFGDILSDEAAAITGSIGLLPSASLGTEGAGLYEPVHGSAPDIAGRDQANPLATILSLAMMLRYSFGMETEAEAVERAVGEVLSEGYRTADLFGPEASQVGCSRMGELVADRVRA